MNVAGLAKGKMTFLEIIKAQMWLRFFRNYGELKFEHGNFSNESLDQEKYFLSMDLPHLGVEVR